MPMHDWTRVEAGIYHDFHLEWISSIKQALNRGLLPSDYYALAEQIAVGFGPDVLTLQEVDEEDPPSTGGTLLQMKPRTRFFAEEIPDDKRRTSRISVRHVSGDRVIAVIEIVSPGNKSSRNSFEDFVDKAITLLQKRVHLLLLDPFPPTNRDPAGIHDAIWEEYTVKKFALPPEQQLTMVAYEASTPTRAYIETLAVGEPLPEMPLFLAPGLHVPVPLEVTYQAAWEQVPARWQREIAGTN
ncbi:MAG: DUF4058 family protein [Zavarzinella sp.]